MANVGNFTGNVGSPGSGSGSGGNGQGQIEARVGQLNAALQSLKIVINDLRQQGFQGGLIFEALSEKISGLLKTERELTEELEQQKIKFKDNKEQLAVYTKLQGQVQKAIDGTVNSVRGLTKEQIAASRLDQKNSNEAALARQESTKVAQKSELDLLDIIKLRLNRERQVIEAAKEAYEKAEARKKKIAQLNAEEIEKREIDKFKRIVAAEKTAETEAKKAAKAKIETDLQAIRSGKGSARKRLQLEINYLKEVQKRYKEGSEEFEKLQKRIIAAQGKARDASFLGGLRKGFQGAGLGKALGQLTGIGGAVQALRKVFGLLQTAITGSFRASVDFEAQLAQLQAVTGVSNSELSELSKSVLDVAGSTTFTSEEIVKLQTELGKLGFSTQQIVAATEGIARTAQALGEQVGPVAQRVGQILKQYNLSAQETEKVSDVLVSTINSSALSFEGFGTAIQYVGPLAAQVGTEFQTVSAAMAILADNGFTASRIGTGLRGIFTELSKSGRDLESAIKKLSKEEISFAQAIELVGKRNAGQLISLIQNVDALEDLEGKYYQVGAANIAASQQVDTFKGNLQLLNSALNRVGIEFGNTIKNAGILKLALRLLDEEGYNTAVAMETLANANSEVYGKSLTNRSKEFLEDLEEIRKTANKYLTLSSYLEDGKDLRIKSKQVIIDGIINPLAEEALNLQNSIEALGYGMGSRKQRKALEKRLEEIKEQIRFTFTTTPTGGRDIVVDYTESLKGMAATINEVGKQIGETAKQVLVDEKRIEVAEGYRKELEKMRDLREDDSLSLKEAADLEFDARQRVKDLDAEILEQQDYIAEARENMGKAGPFGYFGEEELAVEEAKLEALEQQKTNYQNIQRTSKELFVFAQKEYELEFKNLQNNIAARKSLMLQRQEEIKLQIRTIQNQLKGNITEEEKQKLIEKQLELQNELMNEQDNAQQATQRFIDDVNKKLIDQRTLWTRLGFDTRVLDKALERLQSFQAIADELVIDFPEFRKEAETLASTLREKFKKKLSMGIELSEEDKKLVEGDLDKFFEKFGDNLSEEQRQKIEDFIFSSLLADEKSVEKKLKDLLTDIFGKVADAAKAYNDTALENTRNRLNAELDAIRNKYKTEEEILKSQLDNQLITESQFRTKKEELRKKELQEENEIKKAIFEAEKKADLNNVAIETAEALASNIVQNYTNTDSATASIYTILGTAAIVAAGAAKADAIRRRKFFPVQFEEGGFVQGPSHSEGGVPFTVQGQGGYEMEGGEFIVNKKAAAFHRSLLERINGSYKPNPSLQPLQFAEGGLIQKPSSATINVDTGVAESVHYLRAIAEATTTSAIQSSKPVRAYVTERDLRTSDTARQLKDRNTRI